MTVLKSLSAEFLAGCHEEFPKMATCGEGSQAAYIKGGCGRVSTGLGSMQVDWEKWKQVGKMATTHVLYSERLW
jgi:hypothetical protein